MENQIVLGLDWVPNVMHAGFFYAHAKGYYRNAGLDVVINIPTTDEEIDNAVRKVACGVADFVITSSENVMWYNEVEKAPLVAVATLTQSDPSAVITLEKSGINRPKLLEGKIVCESGGLLEMEMLQKMMQHDEGKGQFQTTKMPNRVKGFDALKVSKCEAVWSVLPWEGTIANKEGIKLNFFQPRNYGVPYGYSHLLVTNEKLLKGIKKDRLALFIKTSMMAFVECMENPIEAAMFLSSQKIVEHHNLRDASLMESALISLKQFQMIGLGLGSSMGQFGRMHHHVWEEFAHWITKEKVMKDLKGKHIHHFPLTKIFTNDYL